MISSSAALWLLPFCLPIAIWVAWSDMKFMKIPNKAVMTMAAVWAVVGFFAFPLVQYGWGWALLGIVLAIGFVSSALGLVGAGDAKFAAAMAPYFAGSSAPMVMTLFAGCLLAAFVAHRLMRMVPAFRAATPDWQSWTHRKFPMGLALSGTLCFYFLLGLLISARISP